MNFTKAIETCVRIVICGNEVAGRQLAKLKLINNNNNDFLTKWNESDNNMRRWDDIIITKEI